MTSRRIPSSLLAWLIIFVLVMVLLFAAVAAVTITDARPLSPEEAARVLISLGLAGVLVLALAWWGLQALFLRPLTKLLSAVERLSRGDLSVRVEHAQGGSEVVQLIQAFNELAAVLAQRDARQHEVEAQLQASERRYRRLVELSPDAIFIRTRDEIAFVNQAGARLLGATEPVQLIGRPFWDFIHPEARDLVRERLQAFEADQITSPMELKFLRLDGLAFEAEVSIASLSNGGPSTAQVIIRDITERKQAEAALRESEERFRTMADSAPVLMWVAQPDAQRTFFNKPWLDFTGRALEQEVGLGWTDGLHPDDYQRYLDAYVAAVKARQSFEVEYRLRRADGTYRWLVSVGVPHFTPDEQLTGYTGICLDITERHEAEEALRLSRDQFAFILQSAADGITAQDPNGRLRYANDMAAHMLGFASAEALLAVTWPEILQQIEVYDEANQPFPLDRLPGQRALEGVRKASATVRLRPRAGGDERWLAIKATPVFNDNEQIELAVNIFQDVTELKHAGIAQRLLAEAGRLLATPIDNAARLADVTRLAVPVLADWCAIDVLGEDGSLRRVAVAGTALATTRLVDGHPFELGAPQGASRVVRTGEPELYPFVPDTLLDAIARDDVHLRALSALDLKSAMVVPLLARGGPIGALTFVEVDSPRRYSRRDLALGEELARRVALTLDNVRLYDEAQRLNATLEQRVYTRTTQLLAINARLESEAADREEAQRRLEESQTQLRRLSAHLQAAREEERIRIAREIHDELGQVLAGLKMDVAWLQRSLNRQAPAIAPKLEDMSVLIDATVQAVRRLSAELRPSLLDDLGLAAAMEWQLDEFRGRTGLECGLTTNLTTAVLDKNWATALFHIFQEALTNVARHAEATRVTITLDESPDALTLCVQDNGRGITGAQATQTTSFGLLGMRERVLLLKGEIDIHGAPGQGTSVTVRIPLNKEPRP